MADEPGELIVHGEVRDAVVVEINGKTLVAPNDIVRGRVHNFALDRMRRRQQLNSRRPSCHRVNRQPRLQGPENPNWHSLATKSTLHIEPPEETLLSLPVHSLSISKRAMQDLAATAERQSR